MPQIPAGWYPDPAPPQSGQPPLIRYWDGRIWTPHVAPAGPGPSSGPSPASTPAPSFASAPTQAPERVEAPASWWWRVLAAAIDSFVINLLAGLATLPGQIAFTRDLEEVAEGWEAREPTLTAEEVFSDLGDVLADNAVLLLAPAALIVVIYHVAMLRWKSATLGKLAVGLRVRALPPTESPQLGWGRCIVRVLVWTVLPSLAVMTALLTGNAAIILTTIALVLVFVLINVLLPLWDANRQALHDKAARTQVVKLS